jgi:hypothetical protein
MHDMMGLQIMVLQITANRIEALGMGRKKKVKRMAILGNT